MQAGVLVPPLNGDVWQRYLQRKCTPVLQCQKSSLQLNAHATKQRWPELCSSNEQSTLWRELADWVRPGIKQAKARPVACQWPTPPPPAKNLTDLHELYKSPFAVRGEHLHHLHHSSYATTHFYLVQTFCKLLNECDPFLSGCKKISVIFNVFSAQKLWCPLCIQLLSRQMAI